ncbi:Ig-like domain-containing protein [Pseudomonas sp. TWP3-2]|uniref:Ig-like domain-containing protein n=1 Tax=Pseudomonas sp. TWP3-2 TaxID=2804574 RepID=UPI003CF5C627
MTTSNPPGNTVLVLSRPMINGQTESVVGAMVGLSKAAYELVADGEGAVVIVDPPKAGDMDPGDVMELRLEGDPAVLDSETIKDPNAKTILRIPKRRLHSDRVNELFYTIRRGSNNIGTSLILTVLYNFFRPGLKDRMTEPGGHSELDLLLPDEIKNGVNADFVSAQVCIAYPYCRAYDLISLKCNGELLKPEPMVNPNQAPQPPNPGSEHPITICFTVTRAFLDSAKRLDNKLHFSGSVTDQLGNGPDPEEPWSPVQTAEEDLDGKRLPMPILLEQIADYPGDNAGEIDLEKLAGGPLLLVIPTTDSRFVVGYEVIATYTAKNTGQPADAVVTVSGKVEADPFGQKKPCILEVPNNQIFAASNVIVTYQLNKPNGDLVGNSKPATATVTGSAPVNLQPPTLVAPATSPIDVLAYEEGVTVRIEHLSALPNDQARLLEVDPPPHAKPFLPIAFNQNKRANFKLNPAFLVSRRGASTTLRWELIRQGKPVGESKDLVLKINPIAGDDPRFPPLNIAGDTGEALDVHKLDAGAQILANRWPLQKAGQLIWITCKGFDKSGIPISKDVRSGEPNGSADGLSQEAPVEWLKGLKNETELIIEWAVNLDESLDKVKAVSFPRRSYTVKALHPFTIDTTLMELNGLNINADFLALTGTPAPGTTQTRVPTSGDGCYSYFSSAADVAKVDSNGLVSGIKNASATITVRENSTQREISFPVTVRNVARLVMTPTHTYSISAAINWMNSIGGSPVSNAAIDVLKVKYKPLVSSAGGWLCRNDGCGAGQYLSVVTNNPNAWTISCFTGNNSQAHGWCLLPG